MGNHLPGGGFFPDDGTSKCLVLMARQRALAASKWYWDGAPSPVSRERGALGEAGPAAAGCLPANLSHWQSGKRDALVPASRTAFKLSPGLGSLERVSDGLPQQDLLPVALRAGKLFQGRGDGGKAFCWRLGRLLLCAHSCPLLLSGGTCSHINISSRFGLP